ncbi:hypothetical protein BDW72DRAFT_184511 [Aspergillus terricola var. indicus]
MLILRMLFRALFFAVVCLSVAAAPYAHPIDDRQGPATSDTFSLYAYGDGISGLPVFYADGKAQIGDPKLSTAKVTEEIYFTVSSASPNTWIAHPKKKGAAPFTSVVLALPSGGSAAGDVVFKPETSQLVESDTASVFSVYGNYVLINTAGANFYAEKTDVDGVWDLFWSDSGSDYAAITLRTIAPSTESM